jgi:hypothetical protein
VQSYSVGTLSSSKDDEVGYTQLECDLDGNHLQDGIVLYNWDEAITIEASCSIKRQIGALLHGPGCGDVSNARSGTRKELRGGGGLEGRKLPLPHDRAVHFTRVTGVLDKVVGNHVWRRTSVNELMMDYEPWVRWIDRSDGVHEKIAADEAERRSRSAVHGGGRLTRNSQRMGYQRYFELGEDERRNWDESGLSLSSSSMRMGGVEAER